MKKNIQRQDGIKITNNKNEILGLNNNGYVVIQELLQDPYTIKGRKINLRVYVLLVCKNNEISTYVHNDGFLYYTKGEYKKNSNNLNSNITTGYIDRWIYQVNPLTHQDFRDYLDNNDRDFNDQEQNFRNNNIQISRLVFLRIYDLIKSIISAMDNDVCGESKLSNHLSFQLFGADIALDKDLNPTVMEFNIGPNLEAHDGRDSDVKHMVVRDIFRVLKIVPDEEHKFVKL
jgi:hypothetical protein